MKIIGALGYIRLIQLLNTQVPLPDGRWRVRMEDTRAGDRRWVEGGFTLAGTAATVFYRD
ncbi:MAG: hypothetical protein ACOH5I_14305 [Oligoflexus sp.]